MQQAEDKNNVIHERRNLNHWKNGLKKSNNAQAINSHLLNIHETDK